jgi:conjugal transfer pilus assembly protein TraU
MKSLFNRAHGRLAALLLTFVTATAIAGTNNDSKSDSSNTCHGNMMNPITDVCWSCMFPLSIGSSSILSMGQEDIENPGSPICNCGTLPYGKMGIAIGFWEPVRQVDVTRTPWCFPSLGGMKFSDSSKSTAPRGSVNSGNTGRRASNTSFYQAHWYTNPALSILKVLAETSCLEEGGFDLGYVTELDPSWNNDDLSVILSPDVFLFSTPAAVAACALDCIAASLDFPLAFMQWCGGCQGQMFPLNGHVQAHIGGVQASSLIVQRYAMKLHREFLAFSGHSNLGFCGLYPAPILDKRTYKYSMLYPTTQGKGLDGRCCQPLGRTTVVWGAGKEYPIKGEDFAYMLYRKRNCCEKVIGLMK